MTSVLLTFLGRVPRQGDRYRTVRYDFGDGKPVEPAAFFGWPLAERVKPDRMVILGTEGSMWDHLFDEDVGLGEGAEAERLPLLDAVKRAAVRPSHLIPLEAPLSKRLGREVRLRLIPYCRTEPEQLSLLSRMAEHVERGDRVHLDITHGFETLPVIGMIGGLYLRRARDAHIAGIWHGAYDPDSGEAPVQNVAGLLHAADWLEALAAYDSHGDYGVFGPLLGPAGEQLQKAAFFERTSNPLKAREALNAWVNRRDRIPVDDPATELFSEQVEARLSWRRGPARGAWEKALAWRQLEHGDYLRAAIFGLEAAITSEVQQRGGDVGDYETRDAMREELKQTRDGFRTLGRLRNAMAYGVRPSYGQITKTIGGEDSLKNTLESLFTKLVGQPD